MLDFLKDNTPTSLMRLMSWIILLVSLFVIVYQTINNNIDVWFIITLLGFAFFPKVMQKLIEKKFK